MTRIKINRAGLSCICKFLTKHNIKMSAEVLKQSVITKRGTEISWDSKRESSKTLKQIVKMLNLLITSGHELIFEEE